MTATSRSGPVATAIEQGSATGLAPEDQSSSPSLWIELSLEFMITVIAQLAADDRVLARQE
jgi:hypothetical protein